MSWKNELNLKRVYNAFLRNKKNIYDKDIESLKELNTALLIDVKNDVRGQELFLKLLLVNLSQNIEYYGDIKMALKKVSDDLKLNTSYHIEVLKNNLNLNDKINYFKSIGIDFASYKDETEILSNKQKDILEKLSVNWTYENVERSIYNSANDFLRDLDNY